jgi:hypothetical protein
MKNHYVLKATAADRPCFVCSKFTTAVLTSSDNSNDDWFYVCKSHLTDTHFCTIMGGGTSPKPLSPAVSPKPKAKATDAKAESNSVSDLLTGIGTGIWNSWKGSPKSEDKDDSKGKDDKSKERDEVAQNPPATPSPPPNQPRSSPATYILHRDFYYLREREVQKRRQKKEAAAKLHTMKFPEVPKTLPPSLAKPR